MVTRLRQEKALNRSSDSRSKHREQHLWAGLATARSWEISPCWGVGVERLERSGSEGNAMHAQAASRHIAVLAHGEWLGVVCARPAAWQQHSPPPTSRASGWLHAAARQHARRGGFMYSAEPWRLVSLLAALDAPPTWGLHCPTLPGSILKSVYCGCRRWRVGHKSGHDAGESWALPAPDGFRQNKLLCCPHWMGHVDAHTSSLLSRGCVCKQPSCAAAVLLLPCSFSRTARRCRPPSSRSRVATL